MKNFQEFVLSEKVSKFDSNVVYKLTSKVDAEGEAIPSRFDSNAPLMFHEAKGISVDSGLKKIPGGMFEFMKMEGSAAAVPSGKVVMLTADQVKDTGKKFTRMSGNTKKYEIS